MSHFLCLPGLMCDRRLWRDTQLPGSMIHADLTLDDSIIGMAERALGIAPPQFIAVGLSMGGIVAFQMARLAPERISGLILLDTSPAPDTEDKRMTRYRQENAVRGGALPRIVADELKPQYLARAKRDDPELRALTLDMAMSLGPQVFLRQSKALRNRPDAWPILPLLKMPLFIACGAEDHLCPPDLHHRMAAASSNARLEIVMEAGHLTPLEQPTALNALMIDWVRESIEGRVNG